MSALEPLVDQPEISLGELSERVLLFSQYRRECVAMESVNFALFLEFCHKFDRVANEEAP